MTTTTEPQLDLINIHRLNVNKIDELLFTKQYILASKTINDVYRKYGIETTVVNVVTDYSIIKCNIGTIPTD